MTKYPLCPIPKEQRPFFKYTKGKLSFFLGWVGLNQPKYKNYFWIALTTIFFLNIHIFLFFNKSICNYPLIALFLNLIISHLTLGFFYIFLSCYWSSIGHALFLNEIKYEDSSWLDCKVWIKPQPIVKHEKLLYFYQILPIIKRLNKTLKFIFLNLFIFSFLILSFFY